MSHAPLNHYNRLLADKITRELATRGIEAFYRETRADALEQALSFARPGDVVSCGGSVTLDEIGLPAALIAGPYTFLDPKAAPGSSAAPETVARQAMNANVYYMSCNAITAAGEIVNVDGFGNRVSALAFGPKTVVIVAGVNKITPDLERAVARAREYAAALISLRFLRVPERYEDLSADAAKTCSHLLITERSMVPNRLKVILVGRTLGF